MSVVENRFNGLMELSRIWTDRVATAEANKEVADELLKVVEDWEEYKEEIFQLKAELVLA